MRINFNGPILFCLLFLFSISASAQFKNRCARIEETLEKLAETRTETFHHIKRDLGIPNFQEPKTVRRVPLTDLRGKPILDDSGNMIYTREYDFVRPSDHKAITIQEHTAGHVFPDGKVEPPHFNVRPSDELRHGSVEGTQSHYYVELH